MEGDSQSGQSEAKSGGGIELAIASWSGRTLVDRIGVSEEESEDKGYEQYQEVDPKWHYKVELIIAAGNKVGAKANPRCAWTAL